MGSLARALAVAALAFALFQSGASVAQTFDGTQAIDAYSGLVVGSGRVVGLAGAYVAVAEGLGGTPFNPASVAHRRRDLRGRWDLDGTLSASLLSTNQDLDNDGGRDAALSGFAHVELGGSVQRERLGFGLLARAWLSRGPRSEAGTVGIETGDVSLSGGYSGWNDALVLGASLTLASGALIQYRPDGEEERRISYTDSMYGVGALWRPRGQPFRLGASFASGGRARPRDDDPGSFPGATPVYFEFPWVVAVGASLWVGPNAHLYNEPAFHEIEQHPEAIRDSDHAPDAAHPLLLTVQLDAVGPAKNAVTASGALLPGAPVRRSGEHASFVPRLGAEWELIRRWFRVRGGSYLEPSRTGDGPRSHGTFGAEGRIPCWPWDLQLGFAGDVAERYTEVGLTLGLWGHRGPVAPLRPGEVARAR